MSRPFRGASVAADAGTAREAPMASSRGRAVDLARSGPWFAGFLVVALIAFWPTYLSRIGAQTAYTHLHAITATLWMGLLIAQPVLIRTRRLDLHRMLGRFSFGLVPVIVGSVVLLAHSRIAGLGGEALASQSYLLYLQFSMVALFALCFGLAVWTRRRMELHARFMILTGLTLIDPVVVRLMVWADLGAWNYQWLTFALTDLVILGFIRLERDSPRGRWVLPAMLPVFVLAQIPALFGLTTWSGWQAFARWFSELPL